METMKTAECNTLNRPPTKESVDCQESQHQDPCEVPTVPYLLQDLKSNDITPQKVLASIAWNYLLQTPPKSREDHDHFLTHMAKMGGIIKGIEKGSLLIKVRCVSQQILEELWEDYLSGHLGEVVQRCFVTDEILKELNLAELKLKTTIQEEEYKACKECFEKDTITG